MNEEFDLENVFDQEKPTFEQLAEKVPDGLRQYLEGVKMIADDFTQQQKQVLNPPFPIAAWTPPKVKFAVRQFQFGHPDLVSEFEKLLNEKWEVFNIEGFGQWLIVVFVQREELPNVPATNP